MLRTRITVRCARLDRAVPETYRTVDRSEAALGPPIRTHERLPRVGPGPFVLTTLFAALLWWKALSAERLAGAAWVMTALAAACGVALSFDLTRRQLSSAVSVHERGIVLHRVQGSRVVTWAEIGALEFVRERRLRNQPAVFMPLPGMIVFSGDIVPTEFHWMCRVRVDGRVALELNERFAESSALVETLRARTIEQQLPRLLEDIRGGGRVACGLVAFTEEHLDVRGTVIPWRDIASLTIDGPLLRVIDHAGAEIAKANVEKIPNVHLVMALHERLAAFEPASEQRS